MGYKINENFKKVEKFYIFRFVVHGLKKIFVVVRIMWRMHYLKSTLKFGHALNNEHLRFRKMDIGFS